MKIDLASESTTVTVERTWIVSDAEPVQMQYSSIQIVPIRVAARWVDGKLCRTVVTGGRLLTSGRISEKAIHTVDFWSSDRAKLPEWLRTLIEEAERE